MEPLDIIGQRLVGSLWRTFYESVQDAIALSLLLQIPSLIGKIIIGKDFSSFDDRAETAVYRAKNKRQNRACSDVVVGFKTKMMTEYELNRR